LEYAGSIANPWLKKLTTSIISDPAIAAKYKRAPAAKVMHHAYLGGLLEHVIGLCGLAKQIAAHYPELDVDLLLTAAILHDVGSSTNCATSAPSATPSKANSSATS